MADLIGKAGSVGDFFSGMFTNPKVWVIWFDDNRKQIAILFMISIGTFVYLQ